MSALLDKIRAAAGDRAVPEEIRESETEPGVVLVPVAHDLSRLSGEMQAAGLVVERATVREGGEGYALRWVLHVSEPRDPEVEAALSESEAFDREHATLIDGERAVGHRIIGDLRRNAHLLTQTLARLDEAPGSLYDVEYADGAGPVTAKAALDQIAVALAALSAVVPEPDQ